MSAPARGARYGLTVACRKCPFRTDVPPYLRAGRAAEIADSIRGGGEFPCHQTTVLREDSEGEQRLADVPGTSQVCAGSLGVQLASGQPNQMTRIAERMRMFDPDAVDTTRVYPSLDAFVKAYRAADDQYVDETPFVIDPYDGSKLLFEHCDIVGDDCEDPAGMLVGGMVSSNDEPPTCNPLTDGCSGCGRLACSGCRSDQWGDPYDQYCCNCGTTTRD